jgi:hypothetical protein
LIYSNTELLTSSIEYIQCVNLIKGDTKFDRIFNYNFIVISSRIIHISYEYFLFHFLEKIIVNHIIDNSLDEEGIEKYYREFHEFAYNGLEYLYKISPLKGFILYDQNIRDIVLSEYLQIRRISDEEKILLYRIGISEDIIPINTQWIIEYRIPIKENITDSGRIDSDSDSSHQADKIFYALITLLRLFQHGSIGFNSIITATSKEHLFPPLPTVGFDINGTDAANPYYIFDKNRITEFKRFWRDYNEILMKVYPYRIEKPDKFKNIKNALERYNFANQHELGERAVLDLVISLEALLTGKGDGFGEVAFRVSQRYAKLIERDPDKRMEIFKKIKRYYDFRSRLAHGDREISGFNLIDMHYHTSKCIIKYLDLIKYRNHDQILEILDYS